VVLRALVVGVACDGHRSCQGRGYIARCYIRWLLMLPRKAAAATNSGDRGLRVESKKVVRRKWLDDNTIDQHVITCRVAPDRDY
jgi:hypothetical protein